MSSGPYSGCTQLMWMKQMLKEYDVKLDVMTLFCDNLSAINISKNPIQHSRTKHIDIRHHFIRELVEEKIITLEHVETDLQLAEIFTKALDAIVGAITSSSNPSGLPHKSASATHAPTGSAQPRRRSLRIKHVAPKRGPSKNLGIQNISDDEDDQNPNLPEAVNQEDNEALEKLANVATTANVAPDVELTHQSSPSGSSVKSPASSQEEHDENGLHMKFLPLRRFLFRKPLLYPTKKGKEKKVIASADEDSDGELLIKKAHVPVSGVKKKVADITKQKNEGSAAKTPKTSKSPHIPKSGKETKKYKKSEPSTGKKRRHVSDPDSEVDVEPDVLDISTTARKRMKGNHGGYLCCWFDEDCQESGRCFDKLVREFIVNILADCDDASSAEYRKVFVGGKCINFSPEVINAFLGRSPVAVAQGEPDLNRVVTTLTGKLVRKWPKKGLLPSWRLTAKYAVLYKIGTANWMATNHLSGVTPSLARMLHLIGIAGEFDFGKLLFEQTLKHVGSYAVKLPILFPCLLSEIIAHQQPTIVRADESQGKKPLPLRFDYRLFAGTHVPHIVLSTAKGTASADESQGKKT
ncbi:uncharacterized protein LOC130737756 [Lotus japonicus]|uniref:uncharacterized protein LOC130737756 n=1 Tax=Lotus japonicus TaxID=34305 RepID=UPI00258E977E|nr:uncharacterized protein LOC130737756 [Lotus japonicus]